MFINGTLSHADQEVSENAIKELNARFQESGIGYRFESGYIIRIDSEVIHCEVIKPVITFLNEEKYSVAQDEFLGAHEHYRKGRHAEAFVSALRSFESVMKVICADRGWVLKQNPTAKDLIQACLDNNLIPKSLQSEFTGIRTTLEAGIPTLRNKLAGHGQGKEAVEIPEPLAAYGLHLAAASMLLLARFDSIS